MMLTFILLPVAFLLPPGAGAGEIIGGREAMPHSRPYMASLNIQRGNNTFLCGGFLVSKYFVLTAAHCNGDQITVKLGAHDIKKKEWTQQEILARHRMPHPQYSNKTLNNDIMLLQLAHGAYLNRWVDTIALPRANETVKPGTKCSVSGWGRTGCDPLPHMLQEVDVEVMEDDACLRNRHHPYSHYKASTMMCVGDEKKDKGSWKGDSGGPMVCGQTVQGIVSWGYCCPPKVFARVSSFIPWIEKTMRKRQS